MYSHDKITKKKIEARDVLLSARYNEFNKWNRSPSSSFRSEHPTDASSRIYGGFAMVKPDYSGELLKKDAAVFAMGSCFAREIESALILNGGNVVSVDNSIQRDEFRDAKAEYATVFSIDSHQGLFGRSSCGVLIN